MHVFAMFGADLHAQSVIIDKISVSELRRKFIKSASLVGQVDQHPDHGPTSSIAAMWERTLPLPTTRAAVRRRPGLPSCDLGNFKSPSIQCHTCARAQVGGGMQEELRRAGR